MYYTTTKVRSCPKITALVIIQIILLCFCNTPMCRSSLPEIIYLMLQYSYYCYPGISKLTDLQKKKKNSKNSQAHYFLINMSNYSYFLAFLNRKK